MDTKECNKKTCNKDCACNKKEKKSITEKIVDTIQEDIAAIIKTVKETERT
jgi:hypothetical protein